jgi:hypothetical protein
MTRMIEVADLRPLIHDFAVANIRPSALVSNLSPMSQAYFEKLTAEVIRLYPEYATNPEDIRWNKGNGVFLCIEADGAIRGHIFGDSQEIQHKCYEIAVRKVLQVWRTGYHTGRFEELVFSGKLDEGAFGVQRPYFIGWEGGVPLRTADGKLVAAAFSGFRGVMDIEIIERAAIAVGLTTVART